MNIDVIPDITMRGQDDLYGGSGARRPPTVGGLAARLHDLASRPDDWWPQVRFDPVGPVRRRLAGGNENGDGPGPKVEVWLVIWPPGHRTAVHDHPGTEVHTVLAGELHEITIAAGGVTERPLRANRVRVHGGAHTHELTNPGPAYAITLHARAAPDHPSGTELPVNRRSARAPGA